MNRPLKLWHGILFMALLALFGIFRDGMVIHHLQQMQTTINIQTLMIDALRMEINPDLDDLSRRYQNRLDTFDLSSYEATPDSI